MRPLTVALTGITLAIACASPSESVPPSIDHCLVDGRSLEFETAVRDRIQRATNGPALVSLDPGAVRISAIGESGIAYKYVGEYLVTFVTGNRNVGPVRYYYSGYIFSKTCAADVRTPP